MKSQSSKRLFIIADIIVTIIGLTFSIFYLRNIEDWLLRILTQGFLGLVMLLAGIQSFYHNKKVWGYLFIGISVFTFYGMLYAIYIAFNIGAF